MTLKEMLLDVFFPETLKKAQQENVPEQAVVEADDTTLNAEAKAKRRPKKPGKRPHPVKTFYTWIIGSILLLMGIILIFNAVIPALILIGMTILVIPAGEDFLYKTFGFDFCRQCKGWILIIGTLMFLASLGAIFQS